MVDARSIVVDTNATELAVNGLLIGYSTDKKYNGTFFGFEKVNVMR